MSDQELPLQVYEHPLNERIRGEGLSALHSVRRLVRIEKIPLLGSGKTDYRSLKEGLEAGGGRR